MQKANDDFFRIHRHDVLNHLQLVQAYIQLQRLDEAMLSVSALAGWLNSISLWQQIDVLAQIMVPVAAVTSHVHLKEHHRLPHVLGVWNEELPNAWKWLDDWIKTQQIKYVNVIITGSVIDSSETPIICMLIEATERIKVAWQGRNTHDKCPDFSAIRIIVQEN